MRPNLGQYLSLAEPIAEPHISNTLKSDIRYPDGATAVLPGDRVQFKRWFRYVDGTVVHVPGLSPRRKELDDYDVQEIGIKSFDGLFYGLVIDPETKQVLKSLRFLSRGDLLEPAPESWE